MRIEEIISDEAEGRDIDEPVVLTKYNKASEKHVAKIWVRMNGRKMGGEIKLADPGAPSDISKHKARAIVRKIDEYFNGNEADPTLNEAI